MTLVFLRFRSFERRKTWPDDLIEKRLKSSCKSVGFWLLTGCPMSGLDGRETKSSDWPESHTEISSRLRSTTVNLAHCPALWYDTT